MYCVSYSSYLHARTYICITPTHTHKHIHTYTFTYTVHHYATIIGSYQYDIRDILCLWHIVYGERQLCVWLNVKELVLCTRISWFNWDYYFGMSYMLSLSLLSLSLALIRSHSLSSLSLSLSLFSSSFSLSISLLVHCFFLYLYTHSYP